MPLVRSKVKELSDAYSEPFGISTTEIFAKVVNGFQQNTIFTKHFITDVRLGSEYVF